MHIVTSSCVLWVSYVLVIVHCIQNQMMKMKTTITHRKSPKDRHTHSRQSGQYTWNYWCSIRERIHHNWFHSSTPRTLLWREKSHQRCVWMSANSREKRFQFVSHYTQSFAAAVKLDDATLWDKVSRKCFSSPLLDEEPSIMLKFPSVMTRLSAMTCSSHETADASSMLLRVLRCSGFWPCQAWVI